MLTMDQKAQIRHMVLVEGKSRRQVVRETGHSRNTIKKMLKNAEAPRYEKKAGRVAPILGPYKELITTWVEEDKKKVKKERRTAVRMYQLLKEHHGYAGGESTLRAYVGNLRKKGRNKVYVPLAYDPGETAQVDFGEGLVEIGGKVVKAQLFLMWLGYSGAVFVQAYPAQTQEVFFEGHATAFAFFGGVPREVWYDNLKNAVQKLLRGRNRKEQDSFISFRSHHLFQAQYCNPRSGWEKGGVEGKVGYSRRNWLIGARGFEDWDDLNAYLRQQCELEQQRTLKGRSESIGERLVTEQAQLLPLPASYPCCKTVVVKANKLSLVNFATNRYSIPVAHAHEALTLRAYVDRIEISNGTETIARHRRCWERDQDILQPQHYLPLLAQRPRAFEHAKAIREWRQTWPEAFDVTYARLQKRYEPAQATRMFITILQMGATYSEKALAMALEEALAYECLQPACIQELLRRRHEEVAPSPLSLKGHPQLADIQVSLPVVQQYDQLLAHRGGA